MPLANSLRINSLLVPAVEEDDAIRDAEPQSFRQPECNRPLHRPLLLYSFASASTGRCTDRRTRLSKSNFVRIHHSQLEKTKVAHGARGRADIEWIAGFDQHHHKAIRLGKHRKSV